MSSSVLVKYHTHTEGNENYYTVFSIGEQVLYAMLHEHSSGKIIKVVPRTLMVTEFRNISHWKLSSWGPLTRI